MESSATTPENLTVGPVAAARLLEEEQKNELVFDCPVCGGRGKVPCLEFEECAGPDYINCDTCSDSEFCTMDEFTVCGTCQGYRVITYPPRGVDPITSPQAVIL